MSDWNFHYSDFHYHNYWPNPWISWAHLELQLSMLATAGFHIKPLVWGWGISSGQDWQVQHWSLQSPALERREGQPQQECTPLINPWYYVWMGLAFKKQSCFLTHTPLAWQLKSLMTWKDSKHPVPGGQLMWHQTPLLLPQPWHLQSFIKNT